jgi:tetratricopeptide (TPR) repeat protein
MKTTLLLFACLLSITTFANDAKYYEQMGKQIQAVYAAKSAEEYQSAVNTLDRIAAAEKTKWEPYYYSAFGNIMLANLEKENSKKDSYLDLALAAVEKGKALAPNESELVALEGFVHMIRLTVDPATRGQQYSGLAMQTFGKALGMNPNNPRALALMAQMQLGTARFFNQAPTEACETNKRALELFNATTLSENKLAPVWGKQMAEAVSSNCK